MSDIINPVQLDYPRPPQLSYGGTLSIRSSETGRVIPLYASETATANVANPIKIGANGELPDSYWYEQDIYFEYRDVLGQHVSTIRRNGENASPGGGNLEDRSNVVWTTKSSIYSDWWNYNIYQGNYIQAFKGANSTENNCEGLTNVVSYGDYPPKSMEINEANWEEYLKEGDYVIDQWSGIIGRIVMTKPDGSKYDTFAIYVINPFVAKGGKDVEKQFHNMFKQLRDGQVLSNVIGDKTENLDLTDDYDTSNKNWRCIWYDEFGTFGIAIDYTKVQTLWSSGGGTAGSTVFTPKGVISGTEPSNPVAGMFWVDSSDTGTPPIELPSDPTVKLWSGDAWVPTLYAATQWDMWLNENDNSIWFYTLGAWSQINFEGTFDNFYDKTEINNIVNNFVDLLDDKKINNYLFTSSSLNLPGNVGDTVNLPANSIVNVRGNLVSDGYKLAVIENVNTDFTATARILVNTPAGLTGLPAGGSDRQGLIKNGVAEGAALWADLPHAIWITYFQIANTGTSDVDINKNPNNANTPRIGDLVVSNVAGSSGNYGIITQRLPLYDSATTWRVRVQYAATMAWLPTTGGAMTGDINMGGTHKITELADPFYYDDAATKQYVDSKSNPTGGTPGDLLTLGYNSLVAWTTTNTNVHLNAGNRRLQNVSNPTSNQDAATKYYVDNKNAVATSAISEIILAGVLTDANNPQNSAREVVFQTEANQYAWICNTLTYMLKLSYANSPGNYRNDVFSIKYVSTGVMVPEAEGSEISRPSMDVTSGDTATNSFIYGVLRISTKNGTAGGVKSFLFTYKGDLIFPSDLVSTIRFGGATSGADRLMFKRGNNDANPVTILGNQNVDKQIRGVANPTNNNDVANKQYVDAQVSQAANTAIISPNWTVGSEQNLGNDWYGMHVSGSVASGGTSGGIIQIGNDLPTMSVTNVGSVSGVAKMSTSFQGGTFPIPFRAIEINVSFQAYIGQGNKVMLAYVTPVSETITVDIYITYKKS